MGLFDFLGSPQTLTNARRRAKSEIRTGYDQAYNLLQPSANYQIPQNMIWDLLGLNGAQAQERGYGAYRESPGVAFMRDQGMQAINRGAGARGQAYSGRTLADLGKFNQGIAEQGYNDWLNRLLGVHGTSLGQANNLANLKTGKANALAGITTSMAPQIAAAKTAGPQAMLGLAGDALGALGYGFGSMSGGATAAAPSYYKPPVYSYSMPSIY